MGIAGPRFKVERRIAMTFKHLRPEWNRSGAQERDQWQCG
jgi:hypothetical protein